MALQYMKQTQDEDEDLYAQLKALQKQEEFLDIQVLYNKILTIVCIFLIFYYYFFIQEEYIKDEMRNLKRELIRAKEELRRIQSVPLIIGQFNEMVDVNYGVVNSTAGST